MSAARLEPHESPKVDLFSWNPRRAPVRTRFEWANRLGPRLNNFGDVVWGTGRNGKIPDAAHHFRHLDVRAVGIPARLIAPRVEAPFTYADYYRRSGRDTFTPAASVEQAVAMGGEPPAEWDGDALLAAFPFDLWR